MKMKLINAFTYFFFNKLKYVYIGSKKFVNLNLLYIF